MSKQQLNDVKKMHKVQHGAECERRMWSTECWARSTGNNVSRISLCPRWLHVVTFTCSSWSQMKSGDSKESESRILCTGSNRYLINKVCGEGTYGKVVKAVNLNTSKEVALKILKTDNSAPREVSNLILIIFHVFCWYHAVLPTPPISRFLFLPQMRMLEAMSVLDPTTKNVVHYIERFTDCGKTYLVFERLDMSLYQLLIKQHRSPLTLNEIRPIAHQVKISLSSSGNIPVYLIDL